MKLKFSSTVIEWRGPAPFYFVPVPQSESDQIKAVSKLISYGWGVMPITATIGTTTWTTALFPKDGRYLLPIKNDLRFGEKLSVDDLVKVTLEVKS
jgi:hypothetical protein